MGEYFRLNMPFELGIDVGCRLFRNGCGGKQCLILEAERYRYQAAISDLSNSDIAIHRNDHKPWSRASGTGSITKPTSVRRARLACGAHFSSL